MKQRGAVVEQAEQATLQEPSVAAGNLATELGYVGRLERAGLFSNTSTSSLTDEEVDAMVRRLVEEGENSARIVFFDSLAEQGLLPKPGELRGEEFLKFIFMEPEEQSQWRKRLSKRTAPQSQEAITGSTETDTTPTQHRARVRVRKSYVSPSREGTVTVSAHVEPELKDALKKKFEQSGFDNFNEFLSASLHSIVEKEPTRELKPSAELAAAALEQTHTLEQTIRRLTQDLSRATLKTPSRSR